MLVAATCLLLTLSASQGHTLPHTPIQGLVAAVYTPFTPSGVLNTSVVPQQAAYLNATGVRHILVAGTTGESVKLTVAERKSLAEAWAAAAPSFGIAVLVHVGANALEDARELATHAESLHAAGIVTMSSTYFRPSTVEALAREVGYVFSAAPNTPAYYYHIPSMTLLNNGVGFNMQDLLAIANGTSPTMPSFSIPTLVGIKFTDYDVFEFRATQLAGDDHYDVLYGRDGQLLGAAAMGARGAVGSTYNFLGVYANKVLDSVAANDVAGARTAQDTIVRVIEAFRNPAFAGTDVGKAMMNVLGVPVGPPRLPTAAMSTDQISTLTAIMKDIGLLK